MPDTFSTHCLPCETVLKSRYHVLSVLGEGGFGITYACLDELLEMRVAVKEYFPRGTVTRNCGNGGSTIVISQQEDAFQSAKQTFLQEARILAKFIHEASVVNVTDYFEENGTAYFVMEYLEGQTLAQHIQNKGSYPFEALMHQMRPMMETLARIHERGLIHRDISPDNIMVMADGTLKLMDFGAARDFLHAAPGQNTVTLRCGYAPPEQYLSEGVLGPWTDIYALCATIYRVMTGKVPQESILRKIEDTLPPPSALGVKISSVSEHALHTGMSPNQEQRYQTMQELIDGIFAGIRKPLTIKQLIPTACALLAALIIGGVGWSWYHGAFDPSAETVFHHANCDITLTPAEADTFSPDDQSLLLERLKLLGDITVTEDSAQQISVSLPANTFSDETASRMETLITSYISCPYELYLRTDDGLIYSIPTEHISSVTTEMRPVTDQDLLDYYDLEEGASMPSLKITFDKECSAPAGSIYAVLVHFDEDGLSDSQFLFDFSTLQEDQRTLYIIDGDFLISGITDILTESLLHPITQSTSCTVTGLYPVRWENRHAIQNPGAYQKNQLSDSDLVTLYYQSTEESVADGVFSDVTAGLRSRLDALEIPYRLGYSCRNTKSIAVQVAADDLSLELADLLTASISYCFTDGFDQSVTIYGDLDVRIVPQTDGTHQLVFHLTSEDDIVHLAELTTTLCAQNKPLYLYLEYDTVLCSCPVDTTITNGKLTFTSYYFNGGTAMDETTLPLSQLIEFIANHPRLEEYYYWNSSLCEYTTPDSELKSWNDAQQTALAAQLTRAAYIIDPNIDVRVSSPNWFNFYLNLPLDEELPNRITAELSQLYAALEKTNWKELNYTICVHALEDTTNGESCVFFFQIDSLSHPTALSGHYYDGALEDSKETFQALLEGNNTLSALLDEENHYTISYSEEEYYSY